MTTENNTIKIRPATASPTVVTIAPAALLSVMPAAGVKDVRFYLNAVRLTPGKSGGVLATAADGNIMAFAFDPAGTWNGDRPSIIIRRNATRDTWKDSLLAPLASIKPEKTPGGRVTIATGETENAAALTMPDGLTRGLPSALEDVATRFPDTGGYAAPLFDGSPTPFDSALLERLHAGAAFTVQGKLRRAVTLLANGPTCAGVVVPSFLTDDADAVQWCGVIMPMRVGADPEAAHPALRVSSKVDPKLDAWPVNARPVAGLRWLARAHGIGD